MASSSATSSRPSSTRTPTACSVCVVDDGEGERTIVCGAPNVAAGQTVAVALPGAVMPGGQKLGKAKLRGIESAGMILAEDELELGDDHDGIMVLATGDGAPAPGTPLSEVLPIAEEVLELDLNPNRSDCLGLYGVAREVHAITGATLAPPPWEEDYERDRLGLGRRPRDRHASRCPSSARASPRAPSRASRWARRRSGSAPASSPPGSGRSRTSSTSRTT